MALKNAFENLAVESKQDALIALVGEVQENPTQYTVLDRLKLLKECLDVLAGGASNADLLSAIQSFEQVFIDEDFATETTLLDVVQACQNIDSDTSSLVTLQTATNAALASLLEQLVKQTSWYEVFRYATPDDAALPSGAAVAIHPVLNTEPNVVDTGWLRTGVDTELEATNQLLTVMANTNLDVFVMSATSATGDNIIGDAVPQVSPTAGIPEVVGASFFRRYFRIVVRNTSGSTATELAIRSLGGQAQPMNLVQSLNQPVLGFFPAGLVQAAIRAESADIPGVFDHVQAKSPNDNNSNPGFALETIGYNLTFDPDGNPANRWDRARGIEGHQHVVSEVKTHDFSNNTREAAGSTSSQVFIADATRRALEVKITVPPIDPDTGSPQLFGMHVHFGNGNASSSDDYIHPGETVVYVTNQRLAIVRCDAAIDDVVCFVNKAVPS